jgi:hypothetical protein
VLAPAQLECNVGGLWARNLSGILGGGDAEPLFNFSLVIDAIPFAVTKPNGGPRGTLSTQHGEPDRLLNYNAYPREDATECEAGNEPYRQRIQLGNPEGRQANATEETAPPAGVRELARRAGLLSGPEDGR